MTGVSRAAERDVRGSLCRHTATVWQSWQIKLDTNLGAGRPWIQSLTNRSTPAPCIYPGTQSLALATLYSSWKSISIRPSIL